VNIIDLIKDGLEGSVIELENGVSGLVTDIKVHDHGTGPFHSDPLVLDVEIDGERVETVDEYTEFIKLDKLNLVKSKHNQ